MIDRDADSYDKGGVVKKTGGAKLKKGELVLSKAQAQGLAGMLTEQKSDGKMKPRLEVHASMEPYYPGPPGIEPAHDWRLDEIKRLQAAIDAAEKELTGWDDAAVGKRARKSLAADVAVKKARILEHKASMKASNLRGKAGYY